MSVASGVRFTEPEMDVLFDITLALTAGELDTEVNLDRRAANGLASAYENGDLQTIHDVDSVSWVAGWALRTLNTYGRNYLKNVGCPDVDRRNNLQIEFEVDPQDLTPITDNDYMSDSAADPNLIQNQQIRVARGLIWQHTLQYRVNENGNILTSGGQWRYR
eukprot:UN04445